MTVVSLSLVGGVVVVPENLVIACLDFVPLVFYLDLPVVGVKHFIH